jgi:hypothetical protein
MFDALYDMIDKVQSLDQDRMFDNIIRDPGMQAQIIDLNTEEQLYEQGIRADGTRVGFYSAATVNKWKPLARAEGRDGRADHVTLKDTGEFYGSFEVKPEPGGFVITADPIKPGGEDLTETWGPEILGLTHESIENLIPEIRDRVIQDARAVLFA